MKKLIKCFPAFFLFLLFTTHIQAQTWVMLDADNSVTYIGKEWVKSVESGEEGDLTTMFNTSRNLVIMIDDASAIYAQGSSDEYCNAMKSLRDEMNQQMPPEQRKMMQDMINQEKAKPAPKVTVTKDGGEEIAGYQTTKYTINVDGELFEEKWITNDADLNSIMKVFQQAEDITTKTVTCSLPEGWPLKNSPEFSDEYKNVSKAGIELKSIRYEYGSAQPQTDVISLEQEDIPESEFEVPGDYENVGFQELMMSMSEE